MQPRLLVKQPISKYNNANASPLIYRFGQKVHPHLASSFQSKRQKKH
jgi:hypothetical protein